jgi:hypothetical protein
VNALVESSHIITDATALRERAHEDGYLFFRGLVDADAISGLAELVIETAAELGFVSPHTDDRFVARVRAGAVLAGTGYDDPRWLALQERVLPDTRFTDVGDDARLLAILGALFCEPPMTRRGDICRLVLPGAPHLTTPPHQDHYYTGGTPDLWTAWLPVVDTPLELGPLAVMPGSHRAGLMAHRGEGPGRQGVALAEVLALAASPVAPGDAILFHCLTVHCALPNLTPDRVPSRSTSAINPRASPFTSGASTGPAHAADLQAASRRVQSGARRCRSPRQADAARNTIGSRGARSRFLP